MLDEAATSITSAEEWGIPAAPFRSLSSLFPFPSPLWSSLNPNWDVRFVVLYDSEMGDVLGRRGDAFAQF